MAGIRRPSSGCRKMLLAGLCIGLAVLVGPAAFADFGVTKPYDIAATPGVSLFGNVAGFNIGGAEFAAADAEYATPKSVSVVDASGTAPSISACQDSNDDMLCGDTETGEPSVEACGAADLSLSAVAFDPGVDVIVFVRMADPGCVGGLGTAGTITLTYAGAPPA
ncbi:MAG: hypothetical protein HY775_08060 [Acidobacteria bacterium]|nr:hypothetical protein [Acidobacteriota bacterium]